MIGVENLQLALKLFDLIRAYIKNSLINDAVFRNKLC